MITVSADICMTNILFIGARSNGSQSLQESGGFNQKVYAMFAVRIITSLMLVISICLFNKKCSFHFVIIIFKIEH